MSYGQYIERSMNFILKELDGGWATGNAYTNADGKPMPAYIHYAVANGKRELGVGNPVNANAVYPAFHHALFIRTFLAHGRRTKDPGCLARARQSKGGGAEEVIERIFKERLKTRCSAVALLDACTKH